MNGGDCACLYTSDTIMYHTRIRVFFYICQPGLIIDIYKCILVEHCKIHFTTSLECLLLRPPSRFAILCFGRSNHLANCFYFAVMSMVVVYWDIHVL